MQETRFHARRAPVLCKVIKVVHEACTQETGTSFIDTHVVGSRRPYGIMGKGEREDDRIFSRVVIGVLVGNVQ